MFNKIHDFSYPSCESYCKRIGWVHRYRLLFIRFTPEFLYLVPQGEILVTAPKLQEDGLGTKDEIGSPNVHLDSSNPHLDLVPQELILVMAPKLQEDWLGTKVISISLCLLSL